jgi:hypothetical protein
MTRHQHTNLNQANGTEQRRKRKRLEPTLHGQTGNSNQHQRSAQMPLHEPACHPRRCVVYIYIYSFSSTKLNSDRSLRESISAAKKTSKVYICIDKCSLPTLPLDLDARDVQYRLTKDRNVAGYTEPTGCDWGAQWRRDALKANSAGIHLLGILGSAILST